MSDKEDDDPRTVEKPPIWMVSFADVTALTLTFFVLLFSMSTFKVNEFVAVTSAISLSKKTTADINPAPTSERAINKSQAIRALSLDYVHKLIQSKIAILDRQDEVFIDQKESAIVVTLSDRLLFDPGSFVLSRDAKQLLFGISSALSSISNQVDVVGHAAPRPGDIAEGNITPWELSLLRALTVSRILVDSGYKKPLSTLANADGFFEDIDPSLTLEQRRTLSKRVDIIIRENVSGQ